MDIKLDAEAVQSLASAAILQTLDEEARTKVLEQAVASLLTPARDRYSTGPTPLQQAFNNAINQAAYDVVRKRVADDPRVADKIAELLGPMINGALDAEAGEYRASLAEAIGSAVGTWLAQVARERRDL